MKFKEFRGRGITIKYLKFEGMVGVLSGEIVEPEIPESQPYFCFMIQCTSAIFYNYYETLLYNNDLSLYSTAYCQYALTKSDQYLLDLKLEEVFSENPGIC